MKITTDYYCDVSEWTDEEVQQAAEIFKDAVEGYTIGCLERFLNYQFLMFEDYSSVIYVGCDENIEGNTQLTKEEVFSMLDKGDDEVNWNGDSLPPVGTVCEILGTASGSWSEGVIDYIDSKHCVWHWVYGDQETMYNRVSAMQFRPIKSEKDKAVEELDKYLDEWFDNIILYIDDTYDGLTLPQYLYNLGYRKTQQ